MRRFMPDRRPSPALVVAIVALTAALGGTAAALPGSRSVRADDIATNAVAKRAIKRGGVGRSEVGRRAVGKSELRNNTVDGDETEDNSLSGDDINEGGLGTVPNAANVNADGVETGDIQDDAVTSTKLGAITRRTASVTVPAGTDRTLTRECEQGEDTLGGGAEISANSPDAAEARLLRSRPFTVGNFGWTARAFNSAAPGKTLTVYALCLAP